MAVYILFNPILDIRGRRKRILGDAKFIFQISIRRIRYRARRRRWQKRARANARIMRLSCSREYCFLF